MMSGRRVCDGCGIKVEADEEPTECPDCGYFVCEDCVVHVCTRDQPCTMSGMDEAQCSCGSCRSELVRQSGMNVAWDMRTLKARAPIGDNSLHHNLARGTCLCPFSNLGFAYASGSGPKCYQGAKGGAAYTGPFKCEAQKRMEDLLIEEDAPVPTAGMRQCGREGCDGAGKTFCADCRSVYYCCPECSHAHWSAHEQSCGPFITNSSLPYVDARFRAYHQKHKHYPLEHPQRKSSPDVSQPERSF